MQKTVILNVSPIPSIIDSSYSERDPNKPLKFCALRQIEVDLFMIIVTQYRKSIHLSISLFKIYDIYLYLDLYLATWAISFVLILASTYTISGYVCLSELSFPYNIWII